jgi:hypothetical protein
MEEQLTTTCGPCLSVNCILVSMSTLVPTGPSHKAKLLTAACRDGDATLLGDIEDLVQA